MLARSTFLGGSAIDRDLGIAADLDIGYGIAGECSGGTKVATRRVAPPERSDYSYLSATSGSTFAARRAGT